MSDIKNKTFNSLLNYYNKINDIDKFTLVCKEMVKAKNSTPQMRGEICEVVLYVILSDFIKKNNLNDWRISKGLILKDINSPKDSRYLTELDLTLFTPKCVFSFECKSYRGSKYLDDKGTLHVKKGASYKKVMDVFDQHSKHFNMLYDTLSCAENKDESDSKYKSFKLLYFDFGDVPTEDRRDSKYKSLFPICSEKNLLSIFLGFKDRPSYWNMKSVNRVVDIIEKAGEKNTSLHLDYVTSLNHNRNKK